MTSHSQVVAVLTQQAAAPHRLSFTSATPDCEAALAQAPELFAGGDRVWVLQPDYLAFLRAYGFFELDYYRYAEKSHLNLCLFTPEQMTQASQIVYLPAGVDLGDDIELSTDHLVPFAGDPDGEWAFCFDVSFPYTDYPVYYHHQDQPRARCKLTEQWHGSTRAAPDFANFSQWLAWLAQTMSDQDAMEALGQPYWQSVESSVAE